MVVKINGSEIDTDEVSVEFSDGVILHVADDGYSVIIDDGETVFAETSISEIAENS